MSKSLRGQWTGAVDFIQSVKTKFDMGAKASIKHLVFICETDQ